MASLQQYSTSCFKWSQWSSSQLLDLDMAELGVDIQQSPFLMSNLDQLHSELKSKKLRIKPHAWLSDEWFTPDGSTGIAVPFFLAHPRLMELEREMMGDVEGGNGRDCMKLLRHETGHVLANAFGLRRIKRLQRVFGKSSLPYPSSYVPRPYSKRYVVHLESWYAQSHPDEDFAETFAVWLTPNNQWQQQYQGWPALHKIETVDTVMRELSDRKPELRTRSKIEPINELSYTLGEHYRIKRNYFGKHPDLKFDSHLMKLFPPGPSGAPNAAQFLRRIERKAVQRVSKRVGIYQYRVKPAARHLINRCAQLKLTVRDSPEKAEVDFMLLLTAQVMHRAQTGSDRVIF